MVIFLAGGHGVGKTFLGKPTAEALGFPHATASALIKAELGSANWSEQKQVSDADGNQEALIAAVTRVLETEGKLVLDGHFVLWGKNGDLVPLPVDVFRRLKVTGVILLEASATAVFQRLEARGASQPVERIEVLAAAELQHATHICQELGIPLLRLSSPTAEDMQSAIAKIGPHKNKHDG